jgi:hypothetical protein
MVNIDNVVIVNAIYTVLGYTEKFLTSREATNL